MALIAHQTQGPNQTALLRSKSWSQGIKLRSFVAFQLVHKTAAFIPLKHLFYLRTTFDHSSKCIIKTLTKDSNITIFLPHPFSLSKGKSGQLLKSMAMHFLKLDAAISLPLLILKADRSAIGGTVKAKVVFVNWLAPPHPPCTLLGDGFVSTHVAMTELHFVRGPSFGAVEITATTYFFVGFVS